MYNLIIYIYIINEIDEMTMFQPSIKNLDVEKFHGLSDFLN